MTHIPRPIPLSRKVFLRSQKEKELIIRNPDKTLGRIIRKSPTSIIIQYIDLKIYKGCSVIITDKELTTGIPKNRVTQIIINS